MSDTVICRCKECREGRCQICNRVDEKAIQEFFRINAAVLNKAVERDIAESLKVRFVK
jgi:hypothetical protein